MEDSSGFRPSAGNLEDPPNSRVFLVVSKYATEDLIRERFSDFGDIQDIWVVKDKQTKESKGIAFVKYAKSSQACRAMEEMHGRCLSESTKPIKVFIAQSRGSSNHRDVEDEELTRIFVMIPKSYTEEDVKQKFKEYGQIEYCSIIKNKNTGESKGLAYVRFLKPSQAALAIENCDRSFKAILAEPKNKGGGGSGGGGAENDYHNSARQETMIQHDHTAAATVFSYEYDYSSYDKNTDARTQETISKRLIVVSRLPMIQEQVHNLFDLIPGLEYCEVQRDPYNSFGHAIVQYQNISSAIYAKYKLHGFEYPPGNRLGVTYLNDGGDGSELLRKMASQMVAAQPYERAYGSPVTSQLQTDAALPSIKKKAPSDAQSKERLFIVFNPHPLSLDIMEDAFCRFGNLIEVYIVPGKNVGYARYADVSSANEAIAVLHGKMVNGVKLKVMQADSPRDESNKRQRTY
ncbi:RNA binding motif protein 45 S homeolog isoform X2 [Xenopus laevis]|uniref:RNA binding motif protein 45 S homeolog isoform X2 n=1 Tax=Xenopus laevis TaxID=8355 RepID=A0A8J0TYL8_XENLA|nr:RNA binding motif protein 45 S homeolog isoform X2 [Xenopus laevis]